MTKFSIYLVFIAAFLGYSVAVYTTGTQAPSTMEAFGSTEQEGKRLWSSHNCIACHQLYGLGGQNNHRYDIYGQGRYGTNPFDDFELYRAQSPITHVQTMNTPLLYLHGKQDGSVEYLQGMEFYNALRFLGKPIITAQKYVKA